MITLAQFRNVGAISDVAKIEVTDSATSHTITSGKKGVAFQNQGANICFYGGSTVDMDNNRGWELIPKTGVMFESCSSGFKVYFRCASGNTTDVGVVEFE